MLSGEFELYRVPQGLAALDDPVKIRILHFLERERSFGEIVRQVRRAKSTVSYHLADLEERSLVHSRPHPRSRREKLYNRTGDLLIAVRPGAPGAGMAVTFTDLWADTFRKGSSGP